MQAMFWQRRSQLPRISNQSRPRMVTGCIATLLLVGLIISLFLPRAVYADSTAPNGPGAPSIWAPSTNTIVGTAANTTSLVWFTGYNGIISEVFYPTADIANTTDLQFLVGDSGHSWVDEEKVATTSVAQLYDAHSLAWTVTNTAKNGRYKIVKVIYTDPGRNSLIQRVTFTALNGTLSSYLLYVLYNPTIHNAGSNNTSTTQVYNGRTMLVTTDSSGSYASALAASIPYQAGMTSSAFVGRNDGWTDLKASSNCGSGSCPDYTMNYTYNAANNGNTAQTGLLDLSSGGTINTQTATSLTFNLVLSFGQTSGGTSAITAAEQMLAGTLGDTSDLLGTYVSQWHTFDQSLRTPPAVGSTQAIQQARQQEYYLAANVLKAAQDKQTGAFVAGPGTPWGDSTGDGNGGYHLVWMRDLYEFASALIVAGDTADPIRAVHWAFNTQQQSDGHFPQNSWVNGQPYWNGIQMDEQAFPIILAWKLGITGSSDYNNHIKPAANYIVQHGPTTGQDRWEENGGYSPATIAAEIAGLVCAADIARINGDTASQTLFNNTADSWRNQVVNWTFTTTGPIGNGHYFERIDSDGNPNNGNTISIANGGGNYDERSIVDTSFLELVRQGVMPANSTYITQSLAAVDATIKQTINGYDYWYRYNHDGYGETSSGANYTGAGIGRLWPIFSGERGIYTIASGGSGDAALSAMMAAANSSGLIPEQIWDNAAPAGYTPGTPTKSMNPLNWAMGEFITLLVSASTHTIADVASIVYNRYNSGGGGSCSTGAVSASPCPVQGQQTTITYNGFLASGASSITMHWGYNSWNGITDTPMTKQANGSWQATITVPQSATQLNMAFFNQSNTWDNNNTSNYNLSVNSGGGGSCSTGAVSASPCPVQGQQTTITYNGFLASGASSITMHWGYNSWNGITDTPMTKQANGSWQATITVPQSATQLNMAFFNQSNTWDNNNTSNYNLSVS
ncbi:MAG: amylase [Ktedonobacteraceae bacterium]|nr:amylase [Ktedonobacteraceae bacterium]